MEEPTTYEGCAHCGAEVEIPVGKVSLCPTEGCGHHIRPCNECYDTDECGWGPEGGCTKFPNFRYAMYDRHGEILDGDPLPPEMYRIDDDEVLVLVEGTNEYKMRDSMMHEPHQWTYGQLIHTGAFSPIKADER